MTVTLRNLVYMSAAVISLAAACDSGTTTAGANTPVTPSEEEAGENQSQAINQWFEDEFERQVARSPQTQTFLGRKTNYDQWNTATDEFEQESHRLEMAALAEMRQRFDIENLDPSAQLSYRLAEYEGEMADRRFPFRNHWYQFSHFRGPHTSVPTFMANNHRVDSLEDAQAYIARLEGVQEYLAQHEGIARQQYEDGIFPPKWSFEKMIVTSRNIISGAPFDDSTEPSAMMADLERKIGGLDISDEEKEALMVRGVAALENSVKPAYESLIAMFEEQTAIVSNDDGAWKLPDGDEYYALQLEAMTTTNMGAEEIHNLGLSEIDRIHAEMNAIKENVGFEGSLQDFFVYLRTDPDGRFSYPNTDEGRAAYLAEATAIIDNMRERLDELFYTFPKAELEVRRVEPFREQAAGKGFYQRPAPNGSRPGIFYANLYNTANMPTYQMEALAYHEGIPGHHMQIAIAQELEDVPSFRKFGGFTAYSEGWGLYSEFIPKEMGLYEDPYSDFGRLAMELWRAARLVVDTGIHHKKWTREEAIDYLLENTPNPEGDCINAIERYVVMPGQATAYKIGMIKILELRGRAEAALGDNFDIRAFHDVILKDGPVPMAILEETVNAWITEVRAG
ncbi:DUF885 domain-containing protein [Hyphococcus flavus]|uniref:DUF885 domain-containing protein n=1 Tax=Hyphococcus flavus TaxID=1866326 RepID=A0AAF0CC51_9PROT|nr:DUF885 domain-containing protein [Hyphococcus flavus]WDI32605.1 DUF885 domain-containing protein [Hyphococcus flavus]